MRSQATLHKEVSDLKMLWAISGCPARDMSRGGFSDERFELIYLSENERVVLAK